MLILPALTHTHTKQLGLMAVRRGSEGYEGISPDEPSSCAGLCWSCCCGLTWERLAAGEQGRGLMQEEEMEDWECCPDSSSSRSVNWYTSSSSSSSSSGRKPLVTTPGLGSRRPPRWGWASCCHAWRVADPGGEKNTRQNTQRYWAEYLDSICLLTVHPNTQLLNVSDCNVITWTFH